MFLLLVSEPPYLSHTGSDHGGWKSLCKYPQEAQVKMQVIELCAGGAV